MKRIFAFLYEPASYTVARNQEVYIPMGVDYCYLHGNSEAKNISTLEGKKENLETMTRFQQLRFIRNVLKYYDKIIFNGYSSIEFVFLFLLNLWYCKIIGIDSDTQYREPSNFIIRWIKRIYLSIIFKNRYVFGLAGGNYAHKDLFRKYGMQEDHVLLMPMMVDNNSFDSFGIEKKTIEEQLSFVYVGRLVACKNIEFLIDAFLKYRGKDKKSMLHLVGKGPLENVLKKKYAFCEGVCFDGPKYGKELFEVYKKNHVLILPSVYEPWGLVVNEAMAAGLPVLVSEEVGARYDLVDGHNTGFVFNAYDQDSLVEAMKQISINSTYEEYSYNAHKFMKEYWNYNLYRQCLHHFINL